MWKRKDCMKDEEKRAEDCPVQLVEETQVWSAIFYQTLKMGMLCPSFSKEDIKSQTIFGNLIFQVSLYLQWRFSIFKYYSAPFKIQFPRQGLVFVSTDQMFLLQYTLMSEAQLNTMNTESKKAFIYITHYQVFSVIEILTIL